MGSDARAPGEALMEDKTADKTAVVAGLVAAVKLARVDPHLIFLSRARGESRGADLPGSSIMAADDPEERTTILMVWVGN